MKRAIVWLLTMALSLTMLGGCRTADKTDQTKSTDKKSTTTTKTDIMPLKEAATLTQEQLEQALKGQPESILYDVWGEPDHLLSGMYGATWTVNDRYEIVVYSDGGGYITSAQCLSINEDHLASHITVTSGDTAIRPYSRLTWWRIDNGDGTYDEMIADHCDPVSLVTDQAAAIPTITVKDSVSYSVQVNGTVEAVYLYSPVGDTYASKSTTWETLADLPNGTYYVMLAVLLDGNCDPDAPQNSYRYEDFFRLVVENPNNPEGVVYPTVQLHPLYQKYPEYFGLDGMKGVEVYVWQMAGNLYYCGALIGTNRLKSEEEIQSLFDNGATLEEMRTILELCEIEREEVSIIPVQNPLSSFWYEIDIEYAKQINALFWDD